jgi:hypothetical protein
MKPEKLLINVCHLLAVIMLFFVFAETASAQGTVQLITTATLTKLGDGSYQATVYVSNNGTGSAQNVVFSTASLGSAAGTSALQAVGNIPAGGVASTVPRWLSATAEPTAVAHSAGRSERCCLRLPAIWLH